jgi:hypothetical protein
MLKTGNVDQFVFRAFRTKKVPGIACAEFFVPSKDLFGTAIQDGKQIVHPMQWVSLTILPTPPDGGLVIIGSEQQNEVFNSFAGSLAVGTSACRTASLLSLIFGMTENFIVLPFWWHSLSETQRQRIVNLCCARFFPRGLNIPVDWDFVYGCSVHLFNIPAANERQREDTTISS